jgi:hypothetical protein
VSAGALVVDDHILLRVLLGDEPPDLRPPGTALWTTGLWYHRLCRAVTNPRVVGAMSSALGSVSGDAAGRAIASVTELPETIGLVSLRELAWPMAALVAVGVRLNLLSLEALAAAEQLAAVLCLAASDRNPPLLDAARSRNLEVRMIEVAG